MERALRQAVKESRFETAAELRDRMRQLSARHAGDKQTRTVGPEDIAWAVSCRTGIPVGRLTQSRRQRLLNLEDTLRARVLGQETVVTAVAAAVRRGLSGLRDPKRPIATMLFSGPTGVGKTELCRVLAEELYGSVEAMLRLDMTEFMEKQSASRLIGAPPGYVGYEEGGKLTDAVRRRPYCLVLLDEIEKAHPDVALLLLQIMEEGVLTDSTGRRVSFHNTIVILTCNIGAQLRSDGLGFRPEGRTSEMDSALRQHFTPEFLGRLDGIVGFQPLEPAAMEDIARKYLHQLQQRAEAGGVQLQLPEELARELGSCTGKQGGARQLRRLIQEKVEGPLAVFLLKCAKKPNRVRCKWENGAARFL